MAESHHVSVLDHFADLDDPRVERTRRHKLVDIIAIAICAIICGADSWLGFTQFKRRRQGNLQVGGTVRPGVPECRGQRPTVRNLPTPATGGDAPGRWHPRRSATVCRTKRPCAGSWGAVSATRGRPGWSRRRVPVGRAWCGRWRDRTTGVVSPHPDGFVPRGR